MTDRYLGRTVAGNDAYDTPDGIEYRRPMTDKEYLQHCLTLAAKRASVRGVYKGENDGNGNA